VAVKPDNIGVCSGTIGIVYGRVVSEGIAVLAYEGFFGRSLANEFFGADEFCAEIDSAVTNSESGNRPISIERHVLPINPHLRI